MREPPFLASEETVKFALRSHIPGKQRLDANSRNAPLPGDRLDTEQARFTIIEALFSIIWQLSEKYNCRILLVRDRSEFAPEIDMNLANTLRLDSNADSFEEFSRCLAKEFHQWASQGPRHRFECIERFGKVYVLPRNQSNS